MAAWTVYLSLCLLVALTASEEIDPVVNERCAACLDGWYAFECRCFKFFNYALTWIDAEKFCMDYDANLASVHSNDEYMLIQNLVRYETGGSTRAWIGGHDAVQEGFWLWSDGTKMNFQTWSPGEPDNDGYEHCIEMNYNYGNWNDDSCHVTKPFVCVN
ncbi:ladderlectin-like [Pimephales promelas]|uniref:ladderlectin-like n=1 Tax=Pimephales promelas TaxID=90988 RepID=UPI001955BA0C|nr:ladderlectin-like [Pimephales promelas]